MTSVQPPPDLSGYVDLRVYDRTEQQIIDTMLGRLALAVPEWVPREGTMEMILLELVALAASEQIVAINRVPGAVVETVMLLAGVSRDYGSPANATATFTVGDTLGHTVPPGTRVYLELSSGQHVVFLVVDPGLTIAPGQTTGTVGLIGETNTATANGLPGGTPLLLVDSLSFINGVALASAVADGVDPESTDDWRDRGVNALSQLSDGLIVPRQFRAAALARPEVARAVAIDLYDPTSGNDPGEDAGHITLAVLGDGGALLSTGAKTAIYDALHERTSASLTLHVIDVDLDAVTVVTAVHVLPGFDSAATLDAVEAALAARLNPIDWPGGQIVRRFDLIALVDGVPGVDYVSTLTINGNASDLTLTTPETLPSTGTMTATAV